MRKLLSTLFALVMPLASGWTLDPFPDTDPVTFSFVETYDDVVVADPDFPSEDIVEGRNLVDISGSAPLALTEDQLAFIDEFTDFEIDVGDFNFSGSLGDDENYDSFRGDTSVSIPVEGFDFNGNEIRIGTIALRWTATKVIFTARILNAPEDYWIASVDYYPDVNDLDIDRDDLLAAFVFGDFCFDTRTVYMRGTAQVNQVTKRGITYDVSQVRLEASIDSVAPTIAITEPAPNETKVTPNKVSDGKYTLTGTASDTRTIGVSTFPGVVVAVEVQFVPDETTGPFVPANFDSVTGTWVLPNAPIEAGKNSLIVRALDEHGNYGYTTKRVVIFTSKGDLTVTSEVAGFGPEDTGRIVGVVSGSELAGLANQFDVIAGAPPVVNERGGVESGQIFRVVATPKPGVSFDGWTGVINGETRINSVSQVLDFETKPDLILTARFVPNPFGTLAGTYHGLVNGNDAHERGTFLIKVKDTGAFTGKLKIGNTSIPLNGLILGSGRWSAVIERNGKFFEVSFELNVSATGDRLLTGTVTGDELDSTFDADLKDWKKPKNGAPGKTSEAYAGTYNVVLPADSATTDPNFPNGIGYGRVKITTLGGVSFVGRLGDGSVAKSNSALVKRESGAVFFYIFVALDKKAGNFAGIVNYDNTDPESDLDGTLNWSEPDTTGVEPDGFEGKVALIGSRYVRPLPGTRVMVQTENGSARLRLYGPAYNKPASHNSLPVFSQVDPANLSTVNKIGPAGPFEVKVQFASKSGLFKGTYRDPDLGKSVRVSGVVVQKMSGGSGFAGGVFVRGNRAGFLEFAPVTP